ncbi:MAG UNVERIFIED_CONTAM: hypothetical protein LVR29_13135 [Microcystis novacekii LVE1205-3]
MENSKSVLQQVNLQNIATKVHGFDAESSLGKYIIFRRTTTPRFCTIVRYPIPAM